MSSLPLPLLSELKLQHFRIHDALFNSLRYLQPPGGDIAEGNGCVSVNGTNAVCQCSHNCRDQHYLCLSFTKEFEFVRKSCVMHDYASNFKYYAILYPVCVSFAIVQTLKMIVM